MLKKNTLFDYLLLYGAFLFFSCSGIMGKLASGYPTFSPGFLFFYGCELAILAVYAFIWQQVLKRFELITAYANRPVVTLLGMVWGVVLFHESIRWNMLPGAALIFWGIRLVVTDRGE